MKKKIVAILALVVVLVGCNLKKTPTVDDEALKNISSSLEKRWEYTEGLSNEVTMEELETATQIELDELKEYEHSDFEDFGLYALYDNYRNQLDFMKTVVSTSISDVDSIEFQEKWNRYMSKRAKILYDLNEEYELDISEKNKDIFKEILSNSNDLNEAEKAEEIIKDINGLEGLEIIVEEKSISITYETESVLTVDSFVAHKIGFPEKAMEILQNIKELDYQDVVVSTTNQDSIAISSYFTKSSLDRLNFKKWDELDSIDGYKFYEMSDGYHIRIGIWGELKEETKQNIGNMNKENSNDFWKDHGFTH